jgi:hypothetical protein
MKKFILFLFLIGCSFLSFSQKCYIGFTKDEVSTLLCNDTVLDMIPDTLNQISVFNTRLHFAATYLFNDNDECYSYILSYDYSFMNEIINMLNSLFVKYDERTWLNFTDQGKYKLTLYREKNYFYVQWLFDGK